MSQSVDTDDRSYYLQHNGIETIDLLALFDVSFNLKTAMQYIARAGKKPGSNLVEDITKAQRYLQFERNMAEGRAPSDDGPVIREIGAWPSERGVAGDAAVAYFTYRNNRGRVYRIVLNPYMRMEQRYGHWQIMQPAEIEGLEVYNSKEGNRTLPRVKRFRMDRMVGDLRGTFVTPDGEIAPLVWQPQG
jgi:hypothetical protein